MPRTRQRVSAHVRCYLATRAVRISLGFLLVAALLTLYTMLYASEWQISLGHVGFMLWALCPYCVMAVLTLTIGRKSNAAGIASIAASGAVLAFAAFMYVDAIFIHVSSTSALIFLFGPLYLAIGGVVLFAVVTFLGNAMSGRSDS